MDERIEATYDVLEEIGKGGGGVVYKAYHKRLRKTVVLKKIIDPGRSSYRNRQEVDVLKNVNHSYLPQVLDFLETDEGVFTVMSYIPGKSFQQLLKERARFTKEDLLKWAMQICSALNYLHTREIPIIHGDIKPSNIMLRPDGDICLIDFNIAFFLNENTVLGCTRGYTSPEQFWAVSSKKKREDLRFVIDNKADIYSVGATLYHLATGNVRADYTHEIDIRRLSSFVGPRFAQVIAKATDLDPKKRYNSAAEMYRALQAVPEDSRADLKRERQGKRKVVAGVAAAVLVMCIAAGGWIGYGKYQTEKYNDLVAGMKADVVAGHFDKVGTDFAVAAKIYDDKAEAYYWKDYVLYCQGKYGECASQINDDINNQGIKEDAEKSDKLNEHKSLADLYCLRGTSLLEVANGEQSTTADAVKVFEEAEEKYSSLMRADNYRDYAVALARDGQTDAASAKMDEAEKKAEEVGSTFPEYSVDFTQGEISRMSGKDEEALEHFARVMDSLRGTEIQSDPDKEMMLFRAYMETARIRESQKDHGEAIRVLQEAKETLGRGRLAVIDQELGRCHDERQEWGEASACYKEAAESEGGSPAHWYNYAVEELRLKNPDEAEVGARNYREKSGRGDDFRYLAVMACAEGVRLERIDPNQANYDEFDRRYIQAKNAEAGSPRDQIDDSMVKRLDEAYQRVEGNKAIIRANEAAAGMR